MPDDSKTISRLVATGIPRSKAADDPSTATLMKLFKVPEEHADPLPKIKPMKLTPVEWQPPKVVAPEELPTDNAERYLAELESANLSAGFNAKRCSYLPASKPEAGEHRPLRDVEDSGRVVVGATPRKAHNQHAIRTGKRTGRGAT